MREFLFNPVISPEKKKEVLGKLGKEASLSEYTINFLNILVDQDRLVAADLVFGAFEKRYCELTDTQVRGEQSKLLHCSPNQTCLCLET